MKRISKKNKLKDKDLILELFEPIQTYESEEILEEELIDEIKGILDEELTDAEAIYSLEQDEVRITKLGIINTVINKFLPGFRLVLLVDEKTSIVEDAYLSMPDEEVDE